MRPGVATTISGLFLSTAACTCEKKEGEAALLVGMVAGLVGVLVMPHHSCSPGEQVHLEQKVRWTKHIGVHVHGYTAKECSVRLGW